MGEKAIKKMEITKVLSCFLVFVILMSLAPVFVTQSDAVMLIENYMGKVVGKDIKNNELTVQIEYKADYSTKQVSWVPYHTTSQWAASMDAINEIQIGDYIEICDLSACIGKMRSSEEKIITDVYGDPDYLISVLLGDYIITYENTPDCSKYHGIGISGCNVEAKYSDVTIRKENRQLKSQRLYPSQNYGYEDEEYKVDITLNSGEAPAYPDCTDQPCFGPQAFSDFTIHIIESYKEVKFRGKVLVNRPIISFYSVDVKIDEILNDPTGKLRVGDVVTAWSHRDSPAKIENPAVGDRVEVFGKYFGRDVRAGVESDYIDLETASHYLKIEKKPDLIIQSISCDKGSPKQGDTITFTITVKNQGSGSAETSYVYYYIDGTYVTSDSVPGLSAGSTSTQTFTWTANKCGNVQVKAVADATNAVAESNEGNNQRVETINIGCPKIPAFESKGVYVWGFSEVILKDKDEQKRFFELCKEEGIKTVFLSINKDWLTDSLPWYNSSNYTEFIKGAREMEMQVHAMMGNWSWAKDESNAEPFIEAVLEYNLNKNSNCTFNGIHLDVEPEKYFDDISEFLKGYKDLLTGIKTKFSYSGETILSQDMALSIDVGGCDYWGTEPNDLKNLIGVPDLDYICIMAYKDNATNVTKLAECVVNDAPQNNKPFVISLETQEFKGILRDGNFKTDLPENVTFFEEGQYEFEQELEKLEKNYKDNNAELFKGFAIHQYQSSFTPWHIITNVTWPSGEFNIGDSVNVSVKLRTSDNFNERPVGIGLSVRDKEGNVYPDDFLDSGLDNDTSKIIVMEGRDKEELNLTWKVPEIAEEGWYDVTVAVWDIDFNENEPHESILLKDYPDITEITEIGMYNLGKMNLLGLRKPFVELDREPLKESWKENQFKVFLPGIIFQETFDNLDNWYLVVYNSAGGSENDPAPKLDTSMGNPPPSLDINGDSWCGDGAYSKMTFDYTNGLAIEFDMSVASGYDWNWGRAGLSDHMPNLNNKRPDGAYVDPLRCDPSFVAYVSFTDDGNDNRRPPSLHFGIRAEDGKGDGYTYSSDATDFENKWHNYKISIRPDGYVEFYMNGTLIWTSTKKIDKTLGSMPLILGSRDAYGPVRIDNVKVFSVPSTRGIRSVIYPEDGIWGINKNYALEIYDVSGRDATDISNLAPVDTDRYLSTTKVYLEDENDDGELSSEEIFRNIIDAFLKAKDVADIHKKWAEFLAATYLMAHGASITIHTITESGISAISGIPMVIIMPEPLFSYLSPYGANINGNYRIMGYSTPDKNIVAMACPVNATITDQYGRIIADDGTNEIPNASMLIINETKIFYLPADLTYLTEIDSYDTGTFNFTRVSPIGNDISITKFENIPVTSSTKASVEIEPGVIDYTMSVDYDGDGETDEEKSPDVSETVEVTTPTTIVFEDDFSELNLNTWILFGSPSPHVLASVEGRTGVFDNNGDGWCNSGIVSKENFSFLNGFTMESDMYLKVTDVAGCWDSPVIGLTRQSKPTGEGVCPSEDYPMGVIFGTEYDGDACWATPSEKRRHAYFIIGLYTEEGTWESVSWLNADDYTDAWHNFKIAVGSDRIVKFYVDNDLIYTSKKRINETVLQEKKMFLGIRSSGSAGKAYHDYVKVYATTTPSTSNIIYVPDYYSTIQQAVNAANSGDTIIVRDGTYIENVDVNKPHLTIRSENGADCTIVQAANSNDNVFEVMVDYVNISGFTVKGASAGIFLNRTHYCTIYENAFEKNNFSILLNSSSNNILNNNIVLNGDIGICLAFSSTNTLINNNALNNSIGIIVGFSSNYNVLTNNNALNNEFGINLGSSSNNSISNNNCSNNHYGGICLSHSKSKNSISNNNCSNNHWVGIDLRNSNNNSISNNNCSNNKYYGIYLGASNNNRLSNNNYSNNQGGIGLRYSNNNLIYLNNFINNANNVHPTGSTNIWNSPSKITYTYNGNTYENYLGNYWDDYTGSDANGDGIGDTAYSINSDKDNYPLMQHWEDYFKEL